MENNYRQFIKYVKSGLRDFIEITEDDLDEEIESIREIKKFKSFSEHDILKIKDIIKAEIYITLDKGEVLEEKKHEKWFIESKKDFQMKHWENYKEHLESDKNFPLSVINSMDDILDRQVDLLGDPRREIDYARKGLIIGDVQSGKTANYIGLVCKATDVGYKVIILLTGMTENLRKQTQHRLDEGFVGFDTFKNNELNQMKVRIGVGKYQSPEVYSFTNKDDFKSQAVNSLGRNNFLGGSPGLFVVKKNTSVLKNLKNWLIGISSDIDGKMSLPALIIDDESDNASINTNKEENDPTQINKLIRELMGIFSKVSYVGYTATPFANIFINPDDDEFENQDLFPKDYIYVLNPPSNYIGARNIYNGNGEYNKMLVNILDEEAEEIIPLKHKKDIMINKLPTDMKEAINTFFIANTIRDLRGDNKSHRSMLINVSRFNAIQNQLKDLVNNYSKTLQNACKNYGKFNTEISLKNKYIRSLYKTYEKIYRNHLGNIKWNVNETWESIQSSLYESTYRIGTYLVNQESEDTLNYSDEKSGLRVIAVGGLTLSRGLTLEGLMVSYFYRNSKMYDTLMQMGRWFGYRKGYEYLCRIWMSKESSEWYREISEATDELREDVKRYKDSGLTPLEFGIQVRSNKASLLVTANNKMRSSGIINIPIDLSEGIIETSAIYVEKSRNRYNLKIIKEIVKKLQNDGKIFSNQKNTYGFKNISFKYIRALINELEFPAKNVIYDKKIIIDFIENYDGKELEKWDLFFPKGMSSRKIPLENELNSISMVKRSLMAYKGENFLRVNKSRLGSSQDGEYGLNKYEIQKIRENYRISNNGKTIPQREYFLTKRNPLLSIYFIDPKYGETDENDKELEKVIKELGDVPLIGVSIGIPTLKTSSENKKVNYRINKIKYKQLFGVDINEREEDE